MATTVQTTTVNLSTVAAHLTAAANPKETDNLKETEKLFRAAVETFQSHNNSNVLQRITQCRNAEDLNNNLIRERSRSHTWRDERRNPVWRATESAVAVLDRFRDPIGTLLQINSTVGKPVWGVICFITTILREVFDTRDRLIDLEEHLQECFERYQAFNDKISISSWLRSSLIKFYTVVIRFSLETFTILDLTRFGTIRVILGKSLRGPFESLLKDLHAASEAVHKSETTQLLGTIETVHRSVTANRWHSTPALLTLRKSTRSHYSVPEQRSEHFTGREKELGSILHGFTAGPSNRIRRVALWGTRGVGKTQLALQHCHLLSQTEQRRKGYKHVFWIRSDTREAILSGFSSIAHQVGLCEHSISERENDVLVSRVHEWLQDHGEWLIVFDNAQEVSVVRQFTPTEGNGCILFTTNSKVVAQTLAGSATSIKVATLDHMAAVELLYRITNRSLQSGSHDIPWAKKLCDLVDGLPLALDQIAKNCQSQGINFQLAYKQLEHDVNILRQAHPAGIHEDGLGTAAVLQQSLQRAQRGDASAVALFGLLVFLDVSSIPLTIITKGGPQLQIHFQRPQNYDRGVVFTPDQEEETLRRQADMERLRPLPGVYAGSDPDGNGKIAKGLTPYGPTSKLNKLRQFVRRSVSPTRTSSNAHIPTQNVNSEPFLRLPRIDAPADVALHAYFYSAAGAKLRHVLLDPFAADSAINVLCDCGIVQRPTPDTLWVHDLYAHLMTALIQLEDEECPTPGITAIGVAGPKYTGAVKTGPQPLLEGFSLNNAKVTLLHLAMTLVYLTMNPQAYRGYSAVGRGGVDGIEESWGCEILLPSALRLLEAAQNLPIQTRESVRGSERAQTAVRSTDLLHTTRITRLHTDATIGPEFCRVIASLLMSFRSLGLPMSGPVREAQAHDDRVRALNLLRQGILGYEAALERIGNHSTNEAIELVVQSEHRARQSLRHDCNHNRFAKMDLMSWDVMYGSAPTRLRDTMLALAGELVYPYRYRENHTTDLRVPEELAEGVSWLRRTVDVTRRWHGERSDAYCDTLGRLVKAYYATAQWEDMYAVARERIAVLESGGAWVFGIQGIRVAPDGPRLAGDVGSACRGLGRWDEAMVWFELACEICRGLYREEEPRECIMFWNPMARIEIERGRLEEARRYAGLVLVVGFEAHMGREGADVDGLDYRGVPWELVGCVLENLEFYEAVEKMIEEKRVDGGRET